MEVAVNCTSEDLPTEILENIFSYCSHMDLIQSIPNVCSRWREVAQSSTVWKDVTYYPSRSTTSEQIVEMLEISPKLQNITLMHFYDDRILQAITNCCSELRRLELCFFPVINIDMNFVKKLEEKCRKLQYLQIPNPILTDKCKITAKFNNLKVLHLVGCTNMTFSFILKPVADYCKKLEHLELQSRKFEMNDLHYLLTMRKDTLNTLEVSCSNDSGECVLPVLSTCELKSLSLYEYFHCPSHYLKIEHFGRLKTVKALLIARFSSEDDLKRIFENENMAQLVELSLEGSSGFDSDDAEVIVRNCPLLKNLSLHALSNMTDDTLKIITNLKELSSLSISGTKHVTDAGIFHLQDAKCLKRLNITICEVGMGNIAKLSTLQALSLGVQDLAEFPWDLIPHHMQNLQRLCLWCCTNVDVCAIEKLKIQLPYLKVKVISNF